MRRWLQVFTAAFFVWLCAPDSARAAGDPLVYAVQEALLDEGYDPGWPDGVLGPKTRSAIRAMEADFAMPLTGNLTPHLVETLGLAAYASELGVMQFGGVRPLATPSGSGGTVQVTDAAYDTDAPPPPPPAKASPAGSAAGSSAALPQFRVRDTHPLLADAAPPLADAGPPAGAAQPASPRESAGPSAGETPPAASAAPGERTRPTAGSPFAPRNWLIRDYPEDGAPSRPAFGVFLEEGGKVAGPRFAGRLRWQADGNRFTMTYRNSIGQEIERTGWLHGQSRIEGEATGPDGRTWRWLAEAEPL